MRVSLSLALCGVALAVALTAQAAPPSLIAFTRSLPSASALMVIRPDGSGLRQLARQAEHASWSTDGRFLAYVTFSEIYVANADGSGQRRVPAPGVATSDITGLDWSPDGKKLVVAAGSAFGVDESCDCDLWVLAVDGKTKPHHITQRFRRIEENPSWSPDGRKILFTSGLYMQASGRTAFTLRVVDATGAHARDLPLKGTDPEWSHDGKHITFECGEWPNVNICVAGPDGSHREIVVTHGESPSWSPDDTEMVFRAEGGGGIYTATSGGTRIKRLTSKDDWYPTWR